MSKAQKRPLTGFFETGRKGGQIICRLLVATGPVEAGVASLRVPPELLARTIPLTDDLEDPACR